MGGMIYNEELQRGIKKKTIPPPRIVDFSKAASYSEVIEQAKAVSFSDSKNDNSCFALAGPSGTLYEIQDSENWILQDFMKKHGFQPSKLRLYIVYNSMVRNIILCLCFAILYFHVKGFHAGELEEVQLINSDDDDFIIEQ